MAQRSVDLLRSYALVLQALQGGDVTMPPHLDATMRRGGALERFAAVLDHHPTLRQYLILDNDERMRAVRDVVPLATQLGLPVIIDTLHHALNPGGLCLREALDMALPTWSTVPEVHLASQDPAKQVGAHAVYVNDADRRALLEPLNGREADVMVEAKGKEQAVLALGLSAT